MFTLFDLFELTGPLVGAGLGVWVGIQYGTPGAILGAVGGVVAGRFLGKLPTVLVLKSMHRALSKKSVDDLRAELRREKCLTPNIILLELSSRGEDISQDLPLVLDLLESEDSSKRGFGWAAITSAYPELACRISNYQIYDSVDECKKKVQILRELAEQGATPDRYSAGAP